MKYALAALLLLCLIRPEPTIPLKPAGHAYTDLGAPIQLFSPVAPRSADALEQLERAWHPPYVLTRRGPASDASNCHGWVFTGGRYWVSGDSVEIILAEGYRAVTEPRPGDLVVYRENGVASHTAVVVEGGVEGKFGTHGVYAHAVDDSAYGSDFTYYRSGRAGHLLIGVP